MKINPDKTISSFTEFLSENKNTIGKKDFSDYLFSFRLPEVVPPLRNNLKKIIQNHNKVFYFENANENFYLLGIGSALAISENGLARFSSLNKFYKTIKSKVISNWDLETDRFPMICGGMKFTNEHSEDEWQDFKDSDWFIPEFLQIGISGTEHLFYNFLNQGISINKQIERFSQKLEMILNFQENDNFNVPQVLNSNGFSPKDRKRWKILISDTLDKMAEQNIHKAVISRRVDLTLSHELNWDQMKKYLIHSYPDCYIFIYHNSDSTFFGASPERLFKLQNKNITIDILAGSIPRGKTGDEDTKLENEMLSSSKLISEHDLVLHQVTKAVTKFASKIQTQKVPYKKLLNIQHLHTILQSEILDGTSMFDIIESIFPTAAICGEPKDKALSLIKKIENHKRGLYSGIIGFLNLNNEGEFVVGIRSALLQENKLFAYAGCGIVEDSNPEEEFEESELKLKAILSFFNEKN